jgi:hypothetical protein
MQRRLRRRAIGDEWTNGHNRGAALRVALSAIRCTLDDATPARPRTQGQETSVVRCEAATGVDWM